MRLTKSSARRSRWTPWSVLLWRVFGVNGVSCPTCGRLMTLRASNSPEGSVDEVLAQLAAEVEVERVTRRDLAKRAVFQRTSSG